MANIDSPAITIIYEDSDLLVVDKPANMTVNRAETTRHEVTVQDWAEEKLEVSKMPRVVNVSKDSDTFHSFDTFYERGGVVHRLDKETSGVLLLAKNPVSFVHLQAQFKERIVKKVYWALAHGKVAPEEGEIDVPVGRLPWNRNRFGILPGGRESKTLYKVLSLYEYPGSRETNKEVLTFLELYPQSGRTHQIRVHLKYINHPIFSDFLYAGRKTSRNDRKILPRVFLHAARISFTHPATGENVSFESPLPEELERLLHSSRKI